MDAAEGGHVEIKLPRFKLEYHEDESFSLGKLSLPLIIGFGIHWAWVYLTMFNGEAFFYWNAADVELTATFLYIGSLIFFSGTLFSYALFSHSFRRFFTGDHRRKRNRLIGSLTAAAGVFFMCLADVGSGFGLVALALGGVCTGVGSAVLLMSYGVSFGQGDIATIVTSTGLSLVVGIVIYAVVLNLPGFGHARALLTIVLPLVECYCLYRSSSVLIDKLEFAEITLKVRKVPFALRTCLPGLLFGFALGTTRFEAIQDMQSMGGSDIQLLCIGLAGVIVCSLMIVAMLTHRQQFNFLFKTMIPIITVALVVMYFINGHVPFASTLILLICYLLFESIMWVNYSDLSQRFRLTAFIVFGFGRGSLALGAFIGSLPVLLGAHMTYPPSVESLLILSLACMVIGCVVLPSGKEIRNLIINESESPIGDLAGAEEKKAGQTEETAKAGRFKRKCVTVANRYLLSKKETEVLFLLAKGRNAAAIQEQLYISEGTARTHMWHIYRKLDVHTQQELIDLVEGVAEEVE